MSYPKKKESVLSMEDMVRPEAEAFVMGALLTRPELLTIAKKHITFPEMFYTYKYQIIYKAFLDLSAKGAGIDLITILDAIDNKDAVAFTDLTMTIAEMPISISESKLALHCQVVAKSYMRREVVMKMNEKRDIKEIMELVAQMEKTGTDKFFTPREVALQLMQKLFSENGEGKILYPWKTVQDVLGGIRKGEVVIVAGRPSAGKSTFCENVASFNAEVCGKKVLFASAEMTTDTIGLRIAARKTGINVFNHKEPYTELEQQMLMGVKNQIEQSGLYIHEFTDVAELEAVIQEKARDFDLLVVDYLQLLNPVGRWKSSVEKVTNVANEITRIAKKYHLPTIIAAQFNRQAEKAQPTMGDIKESGQIEQNADVIFSLWTHDNDPVDTMNQKVRVDILKNRNGETRGNYGDVEFYLNFKKPLFKFTDPEWRKK